MACKDRRETEINDIRRLRAEGVKTAGYLCHAFPSAVIAGLGMIPVRLSCNVSSSAESAGERLVRANVCAFVKCALGNAEAGSGLYGEIDIWAGLMTCDQMRRALFMFDELLGLEMHPIQLPATRTESTASYYASQIRRFVLDIEAIHGVRFNAEIALDWQRQKQSSGRLIAELARRSILSPLELHELLHLWTVCSPFGLKNFIEEMLYAAPRYEPTATVIMAGGPMAYEDTFMLEELERMNIAVIPLHCTGLNMLESERQIQDDIGDPIEAISNEAFWRPACARQRPNSGVFNRIRGEIESSGASGLIVKTQTFCDHWNTEKVRLHEAFDLPVIVIDTAYSEGEHQRQAVRIEAFIETLCTSSL